MQYAKQLFTITFIIVMFASCGGSGGDNITLVNVSYDPTREFYENYNRHFREYWENETGQNVDVVMSHGGSGSQARSVIEGNPADVVTLALEGDVDELRLAGLLDENWVNDFPENSSPYTSTIVFLVRTGNPRNIQDWDDLIVQGIDVITPDPRTSGGARWNFLAAWAFADYHSGGDDEYNTEFLRALYTNVSVMDAGARGSTTTFVENRRGDVLLAWENEAHLSMRERPGELEMVTPSISILAQPNVAVVHQNARNHGNEELAKAYLSFLYTDEIQRLAGRHYFRPSNREVLQEFGDFFDLDIQLVTIDNAFGGWAAATQRFFVDGALFEQIIGR